MDIHQLSISYVREQDRILVRINTTAGEEMRLWFTQRLLRGMFPHLGQATVNLVAASTPLADNSENSKQMLAEFKKEESLQKADFKTPFKAEVAKLPLGAEPLLVTEVRITPLGEGRLELAFDEKLADTPNPRGFKMALRPQLMHGMMHLLNAAIKVSEWPIVASASGLTGVASDGTAGESQRPKYMN
jgi:hypothetical protein